MIFNMVGGGSSGGGYAFTLATGAALPGVVDNNCVFILTDTPAQDWHISADMPISPSTGDIWLKTRSGNEYGIAIPDATPFLDVVLVVARQYDGNAWVYRTGYIGVSGVWVEFTPPLPTSNPLENMSWEYINRVSIAGVAADYWNVGDQKSIALDAAVFGSSAITVEIVDMAHDPLADGSGVASLTFCMVDCFATKQRTGIASSWGWSTCELRASLQSEVYNSFPAEVRAVIKTVSKQTGLSGARDILESTNDTLFLPSHIELVGSAFNQNYAHYGEGYQYAGFPSVASRIKKVNTVAVPWWTRSPAATGSTNYYAITTTEGNAATASGAVANATNVACMFCV